MIQAIDFDAIIIGGGHNGLVCATYLSRAGLKVAVLERRPIVGGATSNEELWPGYKISRAAYLPGIRQYIVEDLSLVEHGLKLVPIDPQNLVFFPNGRHLYIFRSHERTAEEIAKISEHDSKAFLELGKFANRFADIISPLLANVPPTMTDIFDELSKDSELSEEFLRRVFFTSCKDLLNETFESDEIKAAFCTHGVYNSTMSINDIGTSYSLVMSIARPGNYYAVGGIGTLIDALVSSAISSGCKIFTNCGVGRVLIEKGNAVGVELSDGKKLYSKIVVSNADPKQTFTKMVEPSDLSEDFIQRIRRLKGQGSSFKVNLALDNKLDFKGTEADSNPSRAICEIAPDMSIVESAADECKYGRLPKEVPLNFFCQSASDNTVAPPGKHTLSISARYYPYHLASSNWKDKKEEILESMLDSVEQFCPNLQKLIIHREALSPLDLEEIYSLPEGNVAHIEQSLNQMFAYRPLRGWAKYRTPVKRLYLCGAGTFPGGGVSGAPGHNSAKAILQDWQLIKSS